MDFFFLSTGFLMVILGIVGSFLPVLPGPPTGWIGLLMLHLTKGIPDNWNFLWMTLAIALLATLLDYTLPALSTKKFGGTKKGVWGSSVGLGIGLFFGPVGIVCWPFFRCFFGRTHRKSQRGFQSAKSSYRLLCWVFVFYRFESRHQCCIFLVFCPNFLDTSEGVFLVII